ncbi:MAG: ABC transporter ATP-binding protein [Phycisphaerales bacterium]
MLRVSRVSKTYGGGVRAVDGLSLEVGAGEVFGLLGPNGAGKSTTIGMVIGALEPDEGSVEVGGAGSPSEASARAVMGVAPQSLAVYDEMTAEENLAFFGRLYGMGGSGLKDGVGRMLALARLEDRRRKRVKTFSGGMKRRLNLACAMVHGPRLVLLDEPTAGVDPQSRNAIFESIERVKEEGVSVVYTTHYMEEAQRLCDRVGVIDQGRLLALGTVDELIARHGGQSVVVVQRDEGEERVATDDPVGVVREALTRGNVRGVRVERASLEGVFLNLTGRSLRD